jgi:hypothetical protein
VAKDWSDRRKRARRASPFIDGLRPPAEWNLTAREEFRRYWERIHPDPLTRPNDESAQYIETRRAFVAGVYVMLGKMRSVDALVTECHAFYEMIRRVAGS